MKNRGSSLVWRVVVVVVVLGLIAPGCIEARRQAGDTTSPDTVDSADSDSSTPETDDSDSNPPDTTEPPDDGIVTNDLVPVDTNTPDAVVSGCSNASDCEPEVQDACVSYDCVDNRCVTLLKDDVPCSDGNVCTEGDLCQDGTCEPGDEVDCEDLDPQCWDGLGKECTRDGGCGGVARARGFACDDGNGPEPGTCEKGWRIPDDTCDGQGVCVDRNNLIPTIIHPLAGTWQLVLATAPPANRTGVTVRAVATFDNQGSVTLTGVARSASGLNTIVEGISGTYCTSLNGETHIEVGEFTLTARSDKAGEVMILHNAAENDADTIHGIAVRGNGTASNVSGTYRLVSTAHFSTATPQLMTWQGELGFNDGCINNAGTVTTSDGLGGTHSFDTAASACFSPFQGGQRIIGGLIPAGTATPGAVVPFQWTGAIGGRGDIVLLTRDDGALRYGILLLIRDRANPANLSGEFGFVSLTGGIESPSQLAASIVPRLDVGVIDYRPSNTIGGALSTGEGVGPGWWWTAVAGSRYAHRVDFGGQVFEHSGWVSSSGNLIVGWRVAPTQNVASPQPLSLTPFEGSLFLAIKGADYRVTSAGPSE